MKVVRGIGIEEGPVTFESDFAQETRRLELVQRVVHGRERDIDSCGQRLLMQGFRADVTISGAEQDRRQR